jgi:hypothetical protein
MQTVQQKKSRRNLLLVIAAFALPIIVAKLALELNWLDYGVTNQGQLIENETNLTDLGLGNLDFNQHWLILYVLPEQCHANCEKTLETVHNTYVALGREVPRVTPVALIQSELTTIQKQSVASSKWRIEMIPTEAKKIFDEPKIVIVDPLGNLVLTHSIPNDSAKLPAFGKMIVADMKKLLKYSRIG